MEEREKARHPVDVGQRNLGPIGQSFQLVCRQVSELVLDRSEVVDDQTAIIRMSDPQKSEGVSKTGGCRG